MRLIASIVLLATSSILPAAEPAFTTFDRKHEIGTINLTVVYFVPKDRTPLPDWKDRIDYYVKRISAFHSRELGDGSRLNALVHPKPLVTEKAIAAFRKGDQNATFFSTMDEVKALLKWKPDRKTGFPVLLVMSDFNWREMDDFRRTRLIDGQEVHEGNIAADGRHFPGAESGGARAIYYADPGYGMGLVSADGWRVPYSGSDCVVYHEGLGHSIGLPHPEPLDDSVMGTGQYKFWISESHLNLKQKKTLGWVSPEKEPDRSADLFTKFTALPFPTVPKASEPVKLALTWPKDAVLKAFKVRTQTDLLGKWGTAPLNVFGKPPSSIALGTFDKPTPVSYRVDATLEDGQTVELWGYFQVKKGK